MQKSLTIDQKLSQKKIGIPKWLPWKIYGILAALPFFAPKYHPVYNIVDDIKKEKGPCFVIWNHLSRRDYLFVKQIFGRKKFNMVAGYYEFFRSHLRFLFDAVQVVPKKICDQDLLFLKRTVDLIKKNSSIVFAPEGMSSIYGSNQPIVPGTGRFLQYFRIPVYFMKLEGAYLTSNKTTTKDRPGKVFVTFKKLFDKDDLKGLTGEEIDLKINEAFRHDEYEWNKTKRIKYKIGKDATDNYESLAYKCPKCGKEFEMSGKDNKFYCKHCGNGLTVNEYYDFIPFDNKCVIKNSLTDWVRWERGDIIKEIRANPNYSFTFKTTIGELPKYKLLPKTVTSETTGEGEFKIDHQGLHYVGTRNGKPFSFDVGYGLIHTLAMENESNAFQIMVNGEWFEFYPEKQTYSGKALLLTEEMHRLHANIWKNFPWEAELYK